MSHNLFNSRSTFKLASGKTAALYSLQALEAAGLGKISRLPVSIRIVLEAVLRAGARLAFVSRLRTLCAIAVFFTSRL